MKQKVKLKTIGIELIITALFFIILPLIYTQKLLDPALYSRYLVFSIWLTLTVVIIGIKTYKSHFHFFFSKSDKLIFSALLLFVLINAVSAINSINTAEAIFKTFKELSLATGFFLIYQIIRNNDLGKDLVIKSTIVMAFIFILIAIAQLLKADFSKVTQATSDYGYYLRQAIIDVKSTLANWNLFASYLLLSLPFSIYGSLFYKRFWRILSIITFISAVFFIGLLASKAGWAGLGIFFLVIMAMVYIYLFFHFQKETGKILPLWVKVSLIVGPFVIIAALTILITKSEIKFFRIVSEKVEQVFNPDKALSHIYTIDNPSSAQTRILVWANTIEMAREHPILGVGPGQWRILYAQYGIDGFEHDIRNGSKHFQRPHNDFLWVLAETGILGFALFLIIFFGIIVISFKNAFKNLLIESRVLNLLIFAVLIAFIYMLNVSFDRERIPHNLMIYTLYSLVLFTIPTTALKTFTFNKKNKFLFLLLFFILLGLCLFNNRLASDMYYGDSMALKIRTSTQKKNYQLLLRHARSLEGTFYTLDPFAAPIPFYAGSALSSMGKMNEAKAEFIKANLLHPYHLQALNNLGTCYDLTGDKPNAMEYYKKAIAISPRYKETLVNMAIISFNLNQIDSALLYLKNIPQNEQNPVQFEKAYTTICRKHATLIYSQCNTEKFQDWYNDANKVKGTFVKYQTENDSFENILLKEIGK